jgi:uncharacterized membrane protein HdeD (DUF308 family)
MMVVGIAMMISGVMLMVASIWVKTDIASEILIGIGFVVLGIGTVITTTSMAKGAFG